MSPSDTIINGEEIDVDSWNVSVKPEDLLGNYMLKDTLVHLACHLPRISDVKHFKQWVLVGRAGFFIRIHPIHADDLFDQLKELGPLKLCRSNYDRVLISGAQTISGGLLVRALEAAGVPEVRLNAFGMKSKLSDLSHDFGAEESPTSHLNHFDIGLTVHSPEITLFETTPKPPKSKKGRRHPKGTVFPMLLELGRGMGSVSFKKVQEAEISKIKVYPGLVHAIKCCSAKHLDVGPKTNRSWHNKLSSIETKLARLEGGDVDLGGHRVELSVAGDTPLEAVEIALESGYLHRPIKKLPLRSVTIPHEEYFEHVHDMINAARDKLNVKQTHN
ncbi:hypothetical protein PCANC_26590 [Puccinia coronata f. sp. avenae]|uniref:Uncharacterized protein n=1 Tax=Puccinia coronata f. sp. avenae TaxID=200324 RepID=A0A2N5TCK3_9BASI|nr:hypothetical protein PCANC_26590 [Puccinia coronata f. sp. avenae]